MFEPQSPETWAETGFNIRTLVREDYVSRVVYIKGNIPRYFCFCLQTSSVRIPHKLKRLHGKPLENAKHGNKIKFSNKVTS